MNFVDLQHKVLDTIELFLLFKYTVLLEEHYQRIGRIFPQEQGSTSRTDYILAVLISSSSFLKMSLLIRLKMLHVLVSIIFSRRAIMIAVSARSTNHQKENEELVALSHNQLP